MEAEVQTNTIDLTKPKKLSIAFEQHLEKYHTIFQEAYDRVMAEVKNEIKNTENFVLFVVRAMYAVKDADLHGLHKKEIVVDIVQKIVDCMPIPLEEKTTLKARTLPTIEAIIDTLVYAAKGYMYLKHLGTEVEEAAEAGCAKCQTLCIGRCRGCRRAAAPRSALRADPIDDDQLDLTGMVDEVYNVVKSMVRQRKITVANLVSIGSTIMQVVEEYPNLVGYQKKHIVLSVAHRLVDEIDDNDVDKTTKEIIKIAIDTTLDKTIDFIIKASRGEIEIINKIVESVEAACAKCW